MQMKREHRQHPPTNAEHMTGPSRRLDVDVRWGIGWGVSLALNELGAWSPCSADSARRSKFLDVVSDSGHWLCRFWVGGRRANRRLSPDSPDTIRNGRCRRRSRRSRLHNAEFYSQLIKGNFDPALTGVLAVLGAAVDGFLRYGSDFGLDTRNGWG
jgi:hypothetical protein